MEDNSRRYLGKGGDNKNDDPPMFPIFIPSTTTSNLRITIERMEENKISNFIWNNRKHRIKLKSLTQQREEGGLAIPNLENYFYTTQIQIIVKWMNREAQSKWIKIEK